MNSRYLQDTIMSFIDIICRNYTRSYDIQSFSYLNVSCGISVGEKDVSECDCGILNVNEQTGL